MTRSQGKISKQLVTTWVTVPPCFPARLMDPSPLVGSSRGGGGEQGLGRVWGWVSSLGSGTGVAGGSVKPHGRARDGISHYSDCCWGLGRGRHGRGSASHPHSPALRAFGVILLLRDSGKAALPRGGGEPGGGRKREREEEGQPWLAMGWARFTHQR